MQIEGMDTILEATAGDDLFRDALASGGKKPQNSPRIRSCILSTMEALFEKYREPESTMTNAAINAAGFSLNVFSIGAQIESVRIYPDEGGFYGAVHYGKLRKIPDPKLFIFREAIACSGGFGAEKYMGTLHPCLSVSGKVVTAIYCNYLDKVLRKERGYFFKRALDYSESLITANRHVFNALTVTLSKTGRLSPEEARDILKKARHIPLTLEGAAL